MKENALQAYDKKLQAKQANQTADPAAAVLSVLSTMDSRSFSLYGINGSLINLDSNQRQGMWDQLTTLPEAQRGRAQENFMTWLAANHPD